MPRRGFKASEASLRLVLLLIFLENTPRSASSIEVDDKDSARIQTTWCEVTNVCAACRPAEHSQSRPKCSGQEEPLLGTDLCGCCFSCVASRGLGESCGAQLSVRFNDEISQGTVSILATTRCGEGLACVDFVCRRLETDVYVVPGQDAITLGVASVFDNEDASLTRDNDNRNPDGGLYVPGTTKAVSSTATPSGTSLVPSEDAASYSPRVKPTSDETVTENSQPCYARTNDREFAIDDPPSRVADVVLNDKRFRLDYNVGDLSAELKILLNVVDERYLQSLLDGNGADSLSNGFAFYSDNGSIDAPKPEGEFEALPELRKLVSPDPVRTKREHGPKNIGEILVRSASAHREYTEADRSQVLNASSAEASGQGDESTVRVRITTHPRKVHTLIDLEEEEEEGREDEDDELSNDVKLSYGRRGDGKGNSPARTDVSRSKEVHGAASTPDDETTNYSNAMEIRLNNTISTFSDRLASLELRIGVFERVLEEMAKWCNLGAPATQDCMLPRGVNPQAPGQWSFVYQDTAAGDRPGFDERVALASGIDAVRLRDEQRRLPSGNVPLLEKSRGSGIRVQEAGAAKHPASRRGSDFLDSPQLQLQNHRIVSPTRRLGGFRNSENRRPSDFLGASTGPRPCYRKSARRGYPLDNPSFLREPIVEAGAEQTIRRRVERSVREAEDEDKATRIRVTRIKKPNAPLSAIVFSDRMKNSNRSYIGQNKVRASEPDSAAEKNADSGVGITEFEEPEVSRRDSGRSRRSLKRDDHGISGLLYHALRKIRSGSGVPTRDLERAANLFKVQPLPREGKELVESSWSKLPADTDPYFDAPRIRYVAFPLITRNGESDSHRDDDDDNDNERAATAAQENRMRSFFRNNVETDPRSRGPTPPGKKDIADFRDPLREFSGDDFDHLYENSETGDGDFDYVERLEYIDGEEQPELEIPRVKFDLSTVASTTENRRAVSGSCKSAKTDSGAERDSRTTVRPLNPTGRVENRRDRLGMKPGEENGSGFGANQRPVVATVSDPARTMGSETFNPVSLKISAIERRTGKNGRKLVWR